MIPSPRAVPPLALLLSIAWVPAPAAGQARISEETRILETYPFSEPNPVPILTRDRRLYPYHAFEGYAHEAEPRPWKVVKLENELIEVYVLPEVGGKVWGAVVKATGHEFIYRNEVLKFRNIALRGPWTSGGIEFNFGVVGHTPATATPVDYLLRENDDGSVSCFVGAMDLPSRTRWRVEIRLEPGRASFETRALWINPTPLEQPYYNWMTAAAFARDDLELALPGDGYLTHPGMELPWPEDAQGRWLPLYRNNRFGPAKSYHVVGALHDFFGGYYLDDGWGWGHWAPYEDMPGQKLWLWALSREGGIWEDLLTDTDGQYVEFQAGRLFVQYTPDGSVNPITQAGFDPVSSSAWSESWFPVQGIGGISDASADGALHVEAEAGSVTVGVNAFVAATDTLEVWVNGRRVSAEEVALRPLQPVRRTLAAPGEGVVRVRLPRVRLEWSSDETERRLARPFSTDPAALASIPEADREAHAGRESARGRRTSEARAHYERALALEPWHREALLGLAELAYRSARFDEGVRLVERARQLDAYDPRANFLAGILYRARGSAVDARDAFGWAARSIAYRTAAWTQLAELALGAGDPDEARRYAERALDGDRRALPAREILSVVARLEGPNGSAEAARVRGEMLAIDPLDPFARAEAYLDAPTPASGTHLRAAFRSEYPEQSLLELAIRYAGLGLRDDATRILALDDAPGPVSRAWLAWLRDDAGALGSPADLAFAFPHRTESLPVLEWAAAHTRDWRWRYLLALDLWALDRDDEARTLLAAMRDEPDFAPLYAARAALARAAGIGDAAADLRRATALDPSSRILAVERIRALEDAGAWETAQTAAADARTRFPGDFNLELLHAKALLRLGRAAQAASILEATRVLPSEGARESHRLWAEAHTVLALDALESGSPDLARSHLLAALDWPERLGQGRPYEPEERLQRFLLGLAEDGRGDASAARAAFDAVVAATSDPSDTSDLHAALARAALERLGRAATGAPPTPSDSDDPEIRMIRRALSLTGSLR